MFIKLTGKRVTHGVFRLQIIITITYSVFDRFNHFFTFSQINRYRAVVITLTIVMV